MPNKFVVLEGIDGVGKTTLSQLLTARLIKAGVPCICYDSSPAKSSLLTSAQKKWAREEATVEGSFHLYLASVYHKATIVRELLKEGCVIMDRYIYSVLAHHLALGLDPAYIEHVEQSSILKADRTIYITLPERVRLARLLTRENTTEEDRIPADDESTLLGRKRAWFSKLINQQVSNEQTTENVVESLFYSVCQDN